MAQIILDIVCCLLYTSAADTVGLLTGNEGRAGAAEGIQHYRVCHTGVADGICQQWDRLHGGMVAVLLGLVELPYGCLLYTSGICRTSEGFSRTRLPLIVGASSMLTVYS